MKENSNTHSVKSKVLSYSIEFLIIFISLFLTFELENYGEDQNNRQKEELYLASLEKDLEKDINQLNRRIQDYDNKIEAGYSLLDQLVGPNLNVDSIAYFYGQALQYNFQYNPVNNTFESLKSSGDLKLLINPTLKILLSELDKSYKSTLTTGVSYSDFVNGILWIGFLSEHSDSRYGSVAFQLQGNAEAREFYNLTSHAIKLLEEYQYSIQGTLKKALEVQGAIKEEMQRRAIPSLAVETQDEDLSLEDL